MEYNQLRSPREVEIGDKVFAISRIPALKALPIYNVIADLTSDKGLIGLTELPERTLKDILQFVMVQNGDSWTGFETDTRINNCFAEYKTLLEVVMEMIRENFGFLADGSLPVLLLRSVGAEAESAS